MISVVLGDIAEIHADIIVNAAKPSLLGGGGVDGRLHAVAGPELLAECQKHNGCLPGKAVLTGAYNLPAKYVIHTVAPRYGSANGRETEMLTSCYEESLRIASEVGATSIAFPALGTGSYKFPKQEAARIAISTVQKHLDQNPISVVFVTYNDDDYLIYTQLIESQ